MTENRNVVRFCLESFDQSFSKLSEEIRAGHSCSVFGVQNSMRMAISSALSKKILYLTSSDIFANLAVESFELMGLKTIKMPVIQDEFLYKKAQSIELYLSRLKSLSKIINGDYDVIVAEVSALFSFLPSPQIFFNNILKLKSSFYIHLPIIVNK